MDPNDAGVSAAMHGSDRSRLALGRQSFHLLVLEPDGCVALADTDGSLWTIPVRAVDAVEVRLVTGVAGSSRGPDAVCLPRAVAASDRG